jgi:hypothetical protein
MESYRPRVPVRMRVLRLPKNGGAGVARNRGAEAAAGQVPSAPEPPARAAVRTTSQQHSTASSARVRHALLALGILRRR